VKRRGEDREIEEVEDLDVSKEDAETLTGGFDTEDGPKGGVSTKQHPESPPAVDAG